MSANTTQMRREIEQIPGAVADLLLHGRQHIMEATVAARELDPPYLISVARGSSDHACTFLKYACEVILKRPMASVGPSVKSVYGIDLRCKGALCLAVSQSGQSPDIVGMTGSLRGAGGLTIAITNNVESRLGRTAQHILPMLAGPEKSVAATKTFVTSIVAGLWLIAEIGQDHELLAAIHSLPRILADAVECDWHAVADIIDGDPLYILGRGPTFAIAQEAALKFKETCLIQAESYSSAEVLHGPVSIVDAGFPVVAFAAADAAEQALAAVADSLAHKRAMVFATTSLVEQATPLPAIRTNHWLTDPIALIVSFYAMVEGVARKRGINPDEPRHLNKVTETI